ncbi:hypothetical protein P691DRAFT_689443 [Macrolepiota fuliginosa MF-IS2]|uniref:Uncharacterized protein n=1 Tax=Macrolepiota fuliginosa MF-IS2 TaxID=1400762 RepID=A0A9P5WX22_9AGAR|nr:hypothetical protein P691DRAFT_689443 [Macrolepiota fuliginosa MF-IS2]
MSAVILVHSFWQICQINTINGQHHVDCCNAFGGQWSGDLFITFMSLVLWITKTWKDVNELNAFVDDNYGIVHEGEGHNYFGYSEPRWMPVEQFWTLLLWDKLSIPHKAKKQSHGQGIIILGIEVNANKLTLTLTPDRITALIVQLNCFIIPADGKASRFCLHEWNQLAGWINWSLNVFPLLWPCLSNVYSKIAGLIRPNRQVCVNVTTPNDLAWAQQHLL